MSNLLTTKQVMEYFQVKDRRAIIKFIKQGLKVVPIGSRDYRFRQEDVEEFVNYLIEQAQQNLFEVKPIKRKVKCKTLNVDYETIRINRELNKVI